MKMGNVSNDLRTEEQKLALVKRHASILENIPGAQITIAQVKEKQLSELTAVQVMVLVQLFDDNRAAILAREEEGLSDPQPETAAPPATDPSSTVDASSTSETPAASLPHGDGNSVQGGSVLGAPSEGPGRVAGQDQGASTTVVSPASGNV